jgi:fatty-acyl-CoA synthase
VSAELTVCDALLAAARTPAGVSVIEHDGRSIELPYKELLAHACSIGAALRARGLETGDRVALVLPEIDAFVRSFFGISAAGLVPVPLCPPGQAGDLQTFARQSNHVLSAARVKAIITSPDVAPLLDLRAIPSMPFVVSVDELDGHAPLDAPVAVSLDAIALLQFTSGSTAAPKGVVLTQRNIAANVTAISGPDGLNATLNDVAVSWLPLYHDMGLIGMLLGAVYSPCSVVILSPILFLKRPTVWLETISQYRGTISFAPNFAYDLCRRRVKLSQIAGLDLSSWRIAGCGAEPIRPDSLRAFAEHFASTGFRASSFLPSYGLAEHSLAVTFAKDGVHVDTVDADRLVRDSKAVPVVNGSRSVRIVGCGRPFAGHGLKIVDDSFRELPERHVGSILVSGPSVMRGYFEDPEATREALHDGWLRTGDVGYMADGQLFVCGRTKDLIIRQGRKYHPPDLESAIVEMRGVSVAGVVVFGVTHVEDSDEVVAVLEARTGGRADEVAEQVRRRIRETAGLELDRVVITAPGTIPRTTSGKVRRSETRARFQAGTLVRSVDLTTAP